MMIIKKMATVVVSVILMSSLAMGADWPGFRNADRTGQSSEKNLMDKWPEGGPKELWSVTGLGLGYSSAAIAKGVVYTTGVDPETKEGFIFAYDLKGKPIWKKSYGPGWKGSYKGARTTPVIENDRLYIMTGYGVAKCFDAKTGDPKWSVDTLGTFKGKNITWGISESILIAGDKVICSPGGDDASLVALDKMTGQTKWTTKGLSEKSAYCSPIVVKYANRNIVITMLENSFVGVDADSGEVLWKEKNPKKPGSAYGNINPVSPVYHNGYFYITSGYKCGGAMFQIAKDGKGVKQIWDDAELDVHHGGVVYIDGYLYASSHAANSGKWMCVDFMTGKVMYADKGLGAQGSTIAANGKLYCWDEKKGNLALVNATPKGFDIISSFKIEKGDKEFWAHPAISDAVMYVRHGDVLMAYDIKK
ncbi:MAG: PQQ-like beta-propeller repeat protein [Phycisphaerae bacterium]|nr:PQQ-like beta-propeller repeat protein [Phycisphaerae bacterium]